LTIATEAPAHPRLLSPGFVSGLVLSVLVLTLLFTIGDLRMSIVLIKQFPMGQVAGIVGLLLGYEVTRFIQWYVFARKLRVPVTWQELLFSFAGGEATKSLPAGNYFQNYLLGRIGGIDAAYSAAATTTIIWLEVCAALMTLLVLGVPGWEWLTPVCTILLGGIAYVVTVIARRRRGAVHPEWLAKRRPGRWVLERTDEFLQGAQALLQPGTLVIGLALSFIYLLLAALAFRLVLEGVGVTNASVHQGIVTYMAGLAAGLILPIPVDLGVAELGALGVLLALGIGRDAALASVLVNRMAGIVTGLVVALIVGVSLPAQWHAVFRERRRRSTPPL